jgi:hypothetical protein
MVRSAWPVARVGGTMRVLGRTYDVLAIRYIVPRRPQGGRFYFLTDGEDRVYRFGGSGLYRITWGEMDRTMPGWRKTLAACREAIERETCPV